MSDILTERLQAIVSPRAKKNLRMLATFSDQNISRALDDILTTHIREIAAKTISNPEHVALFDQPEQPGASA